MKSLGLIVALASGALATPLAQGTQPSGCQTLPKGAASLGAKVPMKKENIPQGCNDFEVLVGKTPSFSYSDCVALIMHTARGTSEVDFADGGKFGVIVGDPVISNLTKAFPKARGYPVQVCNMV